MTGPPQNVAGWYLTLIFLLMNARHLGSGKWPSWLLMNAHHH